MKSTTKSYLIGVSAALNIILSILLIIEKSQVAQNRSVPRSDVLQSKVDSIKGPAPEKTPLTKEVSELTYTKEESLLVPVDLLDTFPNILVDENGELDDFVVTRLGLSAPEKTTVKTALRQFILSGQQLEKSHSSLKTDENGNTYLAIDSFNSEIKSARDKMKSEIANGVNEPRSSLVNYLLETSNQINYGVARQELFFTEKDHMPIFRVSKAVPDAPPATSDIVLDGSAGQKQALFAKYGHLLDTNTSVDEVADDIKNGQKLFTERHNFIRSILKE